jgi:hypothetical protein
MKVEGRSWHKIADLLARYSWDPSQPEKLSHERVQIALGIIAEYKGHNAFRLRRLYMRSLKLWFHAHCVTIEFCGPYDISFFKSLCQMIQNKTSRPLSYITHENPLLLTGFRVRYGDNIWSRSVKDNLDTFRHAILLKK